MNEAPDWAKILSGAAQEALRGASTDLDPTRDQEWWVRLERMSRNLTFVDKVLDDPEGAKSAAILMPPSSLGIRLQLASFYLLWRVFANAKAGSQQRELLRHSLQAYQSQDFLSGDGGVQLLNGMRAILTAERKSSSIEELHDAYRAAKECASTFEGVLAFIRLRRFVGLRLFEKQTNLTGEDLELESELQRDFRIERRQLASERSPHLLAEALVHEARFLGSRHVRKYAEALVLLDEAGEVDEQAEGEGELAYKIRAVSYEQQILTIEAMMGLEDAESEIRGSVDEYTRRLEAEIRADLDRTRRESIQLLGLLAAVIALISVLAGGRSSGSLDAILATSFAVTGMVVIGFSVFSGLFTHGPRGSWWPVIVPAIAGLALMGAAVTMFVISPDSSRYGTSIPQPSVSSTP
jgi:hypothetical protein